MALYSGKTGYIKIGSGADAKVIAHMSSFSLEMTSDIIEVVSFGNTYREKVPSILDWSASADGRCDFETDSGQEELIDAHQNGTLVTLGLGLTENVFFEGTCYIESLNVDSDAEDSPTISISFAGSDAILFTNN